VTSTYSVAYNPPFRSILYSSSCVLVCSGVGHLDAYCPGKHSGNHAWPCSTWPAMTTLFGAATRSSLDDVGHTKPDGVDSTRHVQGPGSRPMYWPCTRQVGIQECVSWSSGLCLGQPCVSQRCHGSRGRDRCFAGLVVSMHLEDYPTGNTLGASCSWRSHTTAPGRPVT
jgi:hypothetical protein